jgi:leucyl aminopeptidase (aminopeptidase T)
VTEEMLSRVMSADMEGLRRKGRAVAEALDAASEAHLTSSRGTDLTLDLSGRSAIPDAGELTERGAFGNLPCGEGFISPVGGHGTLVVDGSLAGIGRAAEPPVELIVEGGHLTSARGGQGMAFMELLTEHGEDGTNVAELGIGTNEKAKLTGEILEDEKILGSVHVAFGASAGIGGTIQVPIHLDCIVLKPAVDLDGEAIVRDGELLVE